MENIKHTLDSHERELVAGGAIIDGFTVRCGKCSLYFVVGANVIKMGASIWEIKSVRDLTCPYCGINAPTVPNQTRIQENLGRYRNCDD